VGVVKAIKHPFPLPQLATHYNFRRSFTILDTFAGSSSGCVESFSKLRVDIIEFSPNVITVGFEKIGCDSSRTFIGVGLNSGLFKDLISVSLLSFGHGLTSSSSLVGGP
jgi:hypothetical protein